MATETVTFPGDPAKSLTPSGDITSWTQFKLALAEGGSADGEASPVLNAVLLHGLDRLSGLMGLRGLFGLGGLLGNSLVRVCSSTLVSALAMLSLWVASSELCLCVVGAILLGREGPQDKDACTGFLRVLRLSFLGGGGGPGTEPLAGVDFTLS